MKFVKQQLENKKMAYYFALGKSEAILLRALVWKALLYCPHTKRTEPMLNRLRNMQRVMFSAIPEITEGTDFDKEFDSFN